MAKQEVQNNSPWVVTTIWSLTGIKRKECQIYLDVHWKECPSKKYNLSLSFSLMTHNPQCGKYKYNFGHNKHKFLKDSVTTTYLWNARLWSLDQQEMQNKLKVSSMCHPQSPQQCERLRRTTNTVSTTDKPDAARQLPAGLLQMWLQPWMPAAGSGVDSNLKFHFLSLPCWLSYLFYVTIWWALMSIVKNVLLPHLILCLYQVTITLKFFFE